MSDASENIDPLSDESDEQTALSKKPLLAANRFMRWLILLTVGSFLFGLVCSTIAGNTRSPEIESASTAAMRLSLAATVAGLVCIMIVLRRNSIVALFRGLDSMRTTDKPFSRLVLLNIAALMAATVVNVLVSITVPMFAIGVFLFFLPIFVALLMTAVVFTRGLTKAYFIGFLSSLGCIALVASGLWPIAFMGISFYSPYSYNSYPDPFFLARSSIVVCVAVECLIAYSMLSGIICAGVVHRVHGLPAKTVTDRID